MEHDLSTGMPLVNHTSREHSFTNGGSLLEKAPRTLWEMHEDITVEQPGTERLKNISLQLDFINQKFDAKAEEALERESVQKEWRAVASILDRIFMYFFFAVAMIVFAQGFATSL